ncbi:kinase-like domain-containing protein [Ilyonectria sp. MPI-CAGE-AT-0026]|nr:kinase-like domain-containing protein [Ilyonectria sp. MPI-CAGE-AT-0026]
MASAARPQGFTDDIVQRRVHRQRDQFLQCITKEKVLAIASSRRPGLSCDYFKDPERGSYNLCCFVAFEDGQRWVIRIPLAPCLAWGARSKLEREIATMQFIADKATIPLPKVYAYQLGDGLDPLSSFVILEYVDGRPLSATEVDSLSVDERARLYELLADVYIQLRRHIPFHRLFDDLEGLRPSEIQARYGQRGVLSSATEYTTMLLNLSDNALSNTRSRILDQEQGDDVLYHHHLFRRFVKEDWLDKRLDDGPFVRVHGDLQPFNCMVDERMEITSVLDWEWSRVVPVQYFQPPLWFTGHSTEFLALGYPYLRYLERLDEFLRIMRELEVQKYGDDLLSQEWEHQKSSGGFLVANALENWTDIDRFSTRHINRVWFRGTKDAPKRIETFIREDPTRRDLVERLCRAHEIYKKELQQLDGTSDPGDSATTPDPFPRRPFFGTWESSVPGIITTTLALGSLIIAITFGVWKKRNL